MNKKLWEWIRNEMATIVESNVVLEVTALDDPYVSEQIIAECIVYGKNARSIQELKSYGDLIR